MATPLIPNINPFTGKKFASDAERDAFIAEQKIKNEVRAKAVAEKKTAKEAALEKYKAFLKEHNFTEEEAKIIAQAKGA